jgi:hypothetical protein
MNQNPNNPNPAPGGFKLDAKTIIIGLVVIVVVFLAFRGLGGGNNPEPTNNAPLSNDAPTSGQDQGEPEDDGIDLGEVVVATSIDDVGCPVDVVDAFEPSTLPFYAVARESNIAEGTDVFARLSRGNENLQDTAEITAPENLEDTCITFEFDPASIALEPGEYQVQFFVNGNAADTAEFEVR